MGDTGVVQVPEDVGLTLKPIAAAIDAENAAAIAAAAAGDGCPLLIIIGIIGMLPCAEGAGTTAAAAAGASADAVAAWRSLDEGCPCSC